MITRRDFIKQSSIAATVATLSPWDLMVEELKKKQKLGIQLFSIPKMLSSDFEGGLKMLQKIGYKEIELYGPYDFSADSAKKSWAEAAKFLGFSGSGFFGRDAKQTRMILDDLGMRSPGTHTDLDTLLTKMGPLSQMAHIMGQTYVTLPSIPEDRRKTMDDYKRMADVFNGIGAEAKKNGIKFGYHNHGYGIKPKDGVIGLDVLLKETDPALVFFEMDIFWTTAGGADPIALLNKYPNRYKMLHLKDMKEKKTFSGDGGSVDQWISLFPYLSSLGEGVMDIPGIIRAAKKNGVEHYFIEEDLVANPSVALDISAKYFNKLKG
jgi:sugar phosphate isomerase/epimerase